MTQQYVPKTYLSRFAKDKTLLWGFDKEQKQFTRTNSSDAASEPGFYDTDNAEQQALYRKALGRAEANLGRLLDRLIPAAKRVHATRRGEGILDQKTRTELAIQLYVQMHRTKKARELVKQEIGSLLDVDTHHPAAEGFVRRSHLNRLFDQEQLVTVSRCLMTDYVWMLGVAPKPHVLITSDHPVIFNVTVSPETQTKGSEILFPLSGEVMLALYDRDSASELIRYDGGIIDMTDEIIEHSNRLQSTHALRMLYAREQNAISTSVGC